MRHLEHNVDFCVVGGGLSGMCAAIAAARHGAKVALIHDRPVLGGNASSEIRMWICGAQGLNNRETGLVEEIELENNYRNPSSNFSIWDSVLFQAVKFTPGLTVFLNASVNDATMDGNRITSVKAWQTTSETWHTVKAKLFADCSGDSILSTLTGADFRIGREAREEFGESIQPLVVDKKTMGMSCILPAKPLPPRPSPRPRGRANSLPMSSWPTAVTASPDCPTSGGLNSAAKMTPSMIPRSCGTSCWPSPLASGTTSRTMATTALKTGTWNAASCPANAKAAATRRPSAPKTMSATQNI